MAALLYEIPVRRIDGIETSLLDHKGEVLLIVNVASACGLTSQYTALQRLYEKYRALGFKVLGFPANDFGAQEPGSNDEILDFCTSKFSVKFPMYEKITVKGDGQHPLYAALIDGIPLATFKSDSKFREMLAGYGVKPGRATDITWNFEKFLINREGEPVARFAPDIPPDDPMIVEAIERELAVR
jgi:glutathione peroxidase